MAKSSISELVAKEFSAGIGQLRPAPSMESGRVVRKKPGQPSESSVAVILYKRKPDAEYPFLFVSDSVTAQLGYEPSEFLDDSFVWIDHVHHDDAQRVRAELSKLSQEGRLSLEYRLRHKDGRYRSLRDEMQLVRDKEGTVMEVVGCLTDLAQSKLADEAVRRSEARYRSLVNSSPIGMVTFDMQGEITEFNPAVLTILGASTSDAAKAKDLFSLFPLMEAGISDAIFECLQTGEGGVGEFQYKSKWDREVYTRLHVVPIRDGDGRITGAHAFVEDISDQRRAEELLVSSERLKVLGQIASGVGHTFSNLLQVVSGNANMALTNLDLQEYEVIRSDIEEIIESARSATEAVKRLQQFGRERSHEPTQRKQVFDLTDAVEEAVELCKLWSKADIETQKIAILYDLSLTKGCYVEGIPDQIAWVVLNLLKNAVEALPKGGKIRVLTLIKQDLVHLIVQDNGVGIRKPDVRKITLAFWTTKAGHAGMGLSINCGIIRQHGGSLGVKRMKPRGTTFTVRLPFVKPSDRRKALPKEVSDHTFRILLIDDDQPVVSIFEKGLKMLGQMPFAALSGQQGLKIFEENQVDAVVCDLAMAGMNGWEVARAMDKYCAERGVRKPPFIMLTGWAAQIDEQQARSHPYVDRIVSKPVSVARILEIVVDEVRSALTSASFFGRIDGIDILDYFQIVILTGRPVLAEVTMRSGIRGLVFFDEGKIIHAECGEFQAEEAFYRCVLQTTGVFSNLPWRNPEQVTIQKPGEFLLIESARRRDELRGDGGRGSD